MSSNYLFQNNRLPINYQIIDDPTNTKRLLATKFNSEIMQITYLLIGNTKKTSGQRYELYNWNLTSNLLQLNYRNSDWNCAIKCEITASATFFLLEDPQYTYLYTLDSESFIDKLIISQKKNTISFLDQTKKIRKKADINKRNYVYASGKDLLTLSYTNSTFIRNVFPIPLVYNFNPNNFVLDTKLYQDKLYILYRSVVTYNIYLYQFQQVQLLFQQYPNNTKLTNTGITINEVFRFNNNYISKVIKFVRGVDSITGNMIIWAYNDNQAYKCNKAPCIGFGYDIYNNIIFSSVISTKYNMAFFGKSNLIDIKSFKPTLISEQIGQFQFNSNVYLAEMMSYSNYTITKFLISTSGSLFPTVYLMVSDCKKIKAFQQQNFCKCKIPYIYNTISQTCMKPELDYSDQSLDNVYIAFIAICSILLLTLIFIIYRKFIALKKIRKSWHYNAAQNIIFQ